MDKTLKKSESNWFEVPNQVTDEFLRELNGAPLKCYLLLIRKTWGWHKSGDWMTTSQFQGQTGLSNRSVIDALRWLEDNGYIWSTSYGENGNTKKLYFVTSEESLTTKAMLEDKVITVEQLMQRIQFEAAQAKYKKSVKRGTFLSD